MPDHPSLSFTEAFKASFATAAHALPSGYRRVTWARNQEGEAWATIGPYDGNFIVGLSEGTVLLIDQRSERVLGKWPATNVSGKAVAMLVAEAMAYGRLPRLLGLPCSAGAHRESAGSAAAS